MSKTAARLAKLKDIVWKHEDLWSSIMLHNPRSKKMKWWMEQRWNPWYSNWLYALPRVSCDDDACSLLDEAPGGLSQLREEAHSMGIPIPDIGSKFLGFIRIGSLSSPAMRAASNAAKKKARKKALKKASIRVHDQRTKRGDPTAWLKPSGVRDQRGTGPTVWRPTAPPSVTVPRPDMSETYPDQYAEDMAPQPQPQYAPPSPTPSPTPQYEDEEYDEYDEEYDDGEDYDDEEYDRGPQGGVSVEGWFDRVLSSSRSVYRGIRSHQKEIAAVSNLIVPGSGAALLAVVTLEDQIDRARRGDPHALDQLAALRAKANAGDKDAKKAIETAKKINSKLEQKSA